MAAVSLHSSYNLRLSEVAPILNTCTVQQPRAALSRLHMLLHFVAVSALLYYRISNLVNGSVPLLSWGLITLSELIFSFLWILAQPFRWRPVVRTVAPENLPTDEKLPGVDVFVCTADPKKEPVVEVMNTVLSAMAMDYPPEKLAVYLSDDGGAAVTLYAMKEACVFAESWLPFCRKYGIKTRCPEAFFSSFGEAERDVLESDEFKEEEDKIESKYEVFKRNVEKAAEIEDSVNDDRPPHVEVIYDNKKNAGTMDDRSKLPLLVYVSREKRPSHPHRFKAGALNVLLRVSGVMSNAPYALVLDCDMYCNDPTSAKQAMCFHLDPQLSDSLSLAQFPQIFYNVSKNDIYDGQARSSFKTKYQGMDGQGGTVCAGTGYYIRKKALFCSLYQEDEYLQEPEKNFGSSKKLINSVQALNINYVKEHEMISDSIVVEANKLASCAYEHGTKWGKEVGYRYFTVVEDVFTSLQLQCSGWRSVLIDPARPCFLGASPTNLSDMLGQNRRWSFGLMQIGLSRFSPLVYGPLMRMSILQSMCYAALILDCLYTVPFYALGIVSPICLLYNIPLYPKASEPIFMAFAYIFLSSQLKHVQEVISYGDSFTAALYELRAWMMKSGTCYMFGLRDAILDRISLHEANFTLTNKVVDDEQVRRYELGMYDFHVSTWPLALLCSVYMLNLVSIIMGGARIFQQGDELVAQLVLSLFGVVVNYHFLQGMVLRKDSGRVPPFASSLALLISALLLCFGYLLLF
ncbi:hypothetical protein C2S51_021160 [Perilla frutescens var. frutescens]|nr:hypothetical protein C2S51_021160 [Perilla frutescens var. frutescens]